MTVQQIMLSSVVPAASGNWWTAGGATGCLQALQPKGAASYAASLLDLSGNGNNANEGVAPAWDTSTGWTFNGSTQYLKTGITVDGQYTLIVQIANSATSNVIAGCVSGGRFFGIEAYYGGNQMYYDNGSSVGVTPSATSGNFCVTDKGYRNGVDEGISLTGLGAAAEVFIGCMNNDGGGQIYFWHGDLVASALYSGFLNATAVAGVRAGMAAL